MTRGKLQNKSFSKGVVDFAELPAEYEEELRHAIADVYSGNDLVEELVRRHAKQRITKCNLVFNYPRQQYAALDRGDVPEVINASWLTLSSDAYTNPSITTVTGETLRLPASAKAPDPSNANNSIFRFMISPGQFIGAYNTAILIGGPTADATPGTGKIIAAVNNVKDDTNAPINRDGSTVHLVTWKFKHLDSSEV